MADGDRSAVPLTKMERLSSKLSSSAKRSMQAAAQVGTTVAESSLSAAAKTKEVARGTAEMALGIDDSKADMSVEYLCDVAPYCEVGIETGLANRDAVACIGSNQQLDTVWACGSASIRVCSIELHRAQDLNVEQYLSAGVRPKARCIVGVRRRMFTGHDDGSLCMVDTSESSSLLTSGLPTPLVFRDEDATAPLTAIVAVGEQEVWVADGTGVVRVWEVTAEGGQSIVTDRATATLCLTDGSSGHQQGVRALTSAYGVRGVVWSCSTDITRVWDAWQRTCRMTVDRCTDAHSCVSSTDGVDEFVWTGHGNGSVLKWHARSAELLLAVPAAEMNSRIPGVTRPMIRKRTVRCLVALSEFGDVWVGGTDGYIHVYDIATGALKRSWQAHHSSITAMCVAQCSGADSLKVCTASQRGAHVRIWHADLSQQEVAGSDTERHGTGGGGGGAAGLLRGISKRNRINFYACAEQHLPDSVPLFDHFIVCGTRDESAADPAEWLLKSIGDVQGNHGAAGCPEILWHVPSVEGRQLNLPKIEDFCFPMARDLEDGPKKWLGVPDTPLGHTQPFAFSLTSSPDGGTPFNLYCCCQYVMPPGAAADAEPWCFCIISRYPFFVLHFRVLHLLANAQNGASVTDSADAEGNLLSPAPAASRYGVSTRLFEEEESGLLASPASGAGDDDLISFFANSPSRPAVPPPPVAEDAMAADDPFMLLATRDSSPILPPSVEPAGEASPPAVDSLGGPSPNSGRDKPDFSMPKVGERILGAYKATSTPARGVVTSVSLFPGSDPCSFNRPRRDEMCSARLGLLSTLRHLSTRNFLRLFACTLLERQIVVTGDSVAELADAVLSLPPLLKPYFQWHSMLMPILPLASDSWQAFLDAPVPFLAGVPRGHRITRRLSSSTPAPNEAESDLGPHDHLYMVDLDDNTVRLAYCEGGEPPLPGMDGLAAALQPIVDRLSLVDVASARLGTAGPAVDATVVEAVEQISALFAKWHAALLRQLQGNCNAMDPFDVDECVGQFTGRHADFLNAFSKTQMFAVYAEQHTMSAPEPEPEVLAGVGAPHGESGRQSDAAELGESSSSDDGEDKI